MANNLENDHVQSASLPLSPYFKSSPYFSFKIGLDPGERSSTAQTFHVTSDLGFNHACFPVRTFTPPLDFELTPFQPQFLKPLLRILPIVNLTLMSSENPPPTATDTGRRQREDALALGPRKKAYV